MTASITSSVRAPESEPSQTGINEPSMEDILASIRRIIAEDQSNSLGRSGISGLTRRTASTPSAAVAAEPALAAAPLASAQEDHPTDLSIIELAPSAIETEHLVESQVDMLRASYPAVTEAPVTLDADPQSGDPGEDEGRQEEAYHPHPDAGGRETAYALSPTDHVADDGEPLLSSTTGASITSSFQVLAESVMLQDPGMIERITRETLRPMLKTWLDDHLPSIVERLVRAEIERVARGGRGRD